MANETPKDKYLIDEMQGAKKGDFEVEKHLTEEELARTSHEGSARGSIPGRVRVF